jgi:Type IV secretion system pilin
MFPRRLSRHLRRTGHASAHVAIVLLILSVPSAAFADSTRPIYPAANDLPTVITNIRTTIMLLLFGVATLFALLGAVYRVTAGGDPTLQEKSKLAFKNAAYGYGLAVLAPVLFSILADIVGGPK